MTLILNFFLSSFSTPDVFIVIDGSNKSVDSGLMQRVTAHRISLISSSRPGVGWSTGLPREEREFSFVHAMFL